MGKPASFDKESRKEADIIRLEPVNSKPGQSEKSERLLSRLEDDNFAWLNSFDAEPAPLAKNNPKSTGGPSQLPMVDRGGRDIFDNRLESAGQGRHPISDDDAEGMRRELHRRLQNETRDSLNQPSFRHDTQDVASALSENRPGLMSALLPYVAAACFFAFLAGGAVFYFVAVQSNEDRSRQFSQAPVAASTTENRAPQPREAVPAAQPRVDNVKAVVASSPDKPALVQRSAASVTAASVVPPPAQEAPPVAVTPIPVVEQSKPAAQSPVAELAAPMPTLTGLQRSQSAELKSTTPVMTAAVTPQTSEALPKLAPVPSIAQKPEPAPPASQPSRLVEAQAVGTARLLISPEEEGEMLTRGKETLQEGDVAGARLLLQYLADQGSASGAFLMGQTFDPSVLASIGVRGLKGDTKSARIWYEKAAGMGNRDAVVKLGQLGQ